MSDPLEHAAARCPRSRRETHPMLDNVIAQVLCHKENWPANQTVLLSAILRRSFSLKPACGVESVDLRISRAPRSLRASPRPGPATDRPIPQLRGKAPGVVHSPRHAACPSSLHTDASPPLLGRVPAVLLPLTPARNVGGLLAGVAGSPAAHSSRPQSASLSAKASCHRRPYRNAGTTPGLHHAPRLPRCG